MAWPYLPSTIKIVITYTIGGKLAVNVTFARMADLSPVTLPALTACNNAAVAAWTQEWAPQASDEAEVIEIRSIDWEDANGPQEIRIPVVPIVGQQVGGLVPNNTALVVTHNTVYTGRSWRGRSYIPGLDETDCNATDVITGTVTQAWLDTLVEFNSQLTSAGIDHVVYSLYTNGAPRPTPAAKLVTGYAANPALDTQRRRLT